MKIKKKNSGILQLILRYCNLNKDRIIFGTIHFIRTFFTHAMPNMKAIITFRELLCGQNIRFDSI